MLECYQKSWSKILQNVLIGGWPECLVCKFCLATLDEPELQHNSLTKPTHPFAICPEAGKPVFGGVKGGLDVPASMLLLLPPTL